MNMSGKSCKELSEALSQGAVTKRELMEELAYRLVRHSATGKPITSAQRKLMEELGMDARTDVPTYRGYLDAPAGQKRATAIALYEHENGPLVAKEPLKKRLFPARTAPASAVSAEDLDDLFNEGEPSPSYDPEAVAREFLLSMDRAARLTWLKANVVD